MAAFSRIALIISAGDLPAATGAAAFGASAAATGAAAGAAPAGAAPLARIAAMMSAVPFGLPAGDAVGAAEAAAGATAGAAAAGAAAFARMAAMISAVPFGFSPAEAATGAGAAGGVASTAAGAGAAASGAGAGVGAAAPSAGFLRSIAIISAVVGFLSVMVIGRGEWPRFIRDKRTEPRTELLESVGIVGIMASHYGCDNQSLTAESRFSVSGR